MKPVMPELPKSFGEKKYSPSGIIAPLSIPLIFVSSVLASFVIVTAILALQWVTLMYVIKPMNFGSLGGVVGLVFIVIYGLIGAVGSGYATRFGSRISKNRNLKVIAAIGFVGPYAVCLLIPYLMSIFFYGESLWSMVFMGGVAGLFFAGAAAFIAYFISEDDTFCEKCNGWYTKSKTVNLDVDAAEELIRDLENTDDNGITLKDYKLDNKKNRRLDVTIQNCPRCDDADYRISASIHWQEMVYDKNTKKAVGSNKHEDYFDIIVNQSVGTHILNLLDS